MTSYEVSYHIKIRNMIVEPLLVIYIRLQYQNLIRFLELAATNCPNLKYFRLITKEYKDAKNPDQQETNLGQIKGDLERRNVTVCIKYKDSLHDRKI